METFSASLAYVRGIRWWPVDSPNKEPIMRKQVGSSVLFDVRLNKGLSKQLGIRWFETPLRSLWHHCNDSTKSSKPNDNQTKRDKNRRQIYGRLLYFKEIQLEDDTLACIFLSFSKFVSEFNWYHGVMDVITNLYMQECWPTFMLLCESLATVRVFKHNLTYHIRVISHESHGFSYFNTLSS